MHMYRVIEAHKRNAINFIYGPFNNRPRYWDDDPRDHCSQDCFAIETALIIDGINGLVIDKEIFKFLVRAGIKNFMKNVFPYQRVLIRRKGFSSLDYSRRISRLQVFGFLTRSRVLHGYSPNYLTSVVTGVVLMAMFFKLLDTMNDWPQQLKS
ncbi:hypothetical protein RF11_08675 [Thelohanellus kitauei]|uniref:Uncharacterized protein n=1 Tax=Thelohanellus kitauei TaxID=669202 RepID=A0A0C2MY53_THEKT|nr:hypothetical protein RF11_08675 [Thelohanellus kitauei]